MPLFHMDMYRSEDGDLSSIDMPGYLAEDRLVVIGGHNLLVICQTIILK